MTVNFPAYSTPDYILNLQKLATCVLGQRFRIGHTSHVPASSQKILAVLAGIINCTELCLDTRITPDQQEYLGLVKFSAEHLLNVINDILVSFFLDANRLQWLDGVGGTK